MKQEEIFLKIGIKLNLPFFLFLLFFCLSFQVDGKIFYYNPDIKIETFDPLQGDSGIGYAEYKFLITNSSNKEHDVSIVMPIFIDGYSKYNSFISHLEKSVVVPPLSTVCMVIYQPPYQFTGRAGGQVFIDGHLSYDSSSNSDFFSMSTANSCYENESNILYGSKVPSDLVSDLEKINNNSYKRVNLIRIENSLKNLPESEIGYSRFGMVVFTENEFNQLTSKTQNALWNYVFCGGILGVVGKLNIPESNYFSQSNDIKYYGFGQIMFLKKKLVKKIVKKEILPRFGYEYSEEKSEESEESSGEDSDGDFIEKMKFVFPENLGESLKFRDRSFFGCDLNYRSMLNYFPVIDNINIPVNLIMLITLLFLIIVLPLNLIFVNILKKKILLLFTVPMISLFFAVAIACSILFSDGITPTVRSFTVSFLDQKTKQVFSYGTIGVYSPVSLYYPLRFDSKTILSLKILNNRLLEMDQTDGQLLLDGWVKPRVPSYFFFSKLDKRRERIVFYEANGVIHGVNGFPVAIESIRYADDKGRVFKAENIPAGQKFELNLVDSGFIAQDRISAYEFSRHFVKVSDLGNIKIEDGLLIRNSYVAKIDEQSPFLEKYINGSVIEEKSLSFVFGVNAFYRGKGDLLK